MDTRSIYSRLNPMSGGCIWPLVGLLLLIAGCGRGTYEDRLQETRKYFAFREKLDRNLAVEWKGHGISIRLPKQFRLIPGAKSQPAKEGEDEEREQQPDQRQPEFLNGVQLPGLVAAWRADVNVDGSDQKVAAYLYVLSNYDLWKEKGKDKEALEFNSTASNAVVSGLGVAFPPKAQWVTEKYPRRSGYVREKKFTAVQVEATIPQTITVETKREEPARGEQNVGGDNSTKTNEPAQHEQTIEVDVVCKIYLAEAKDIRVAVVIVIPRQIDVREKLSLENNPSSRIAMCLETLTISSQKPSSGAQSGAGGGAGLGF